MIFTVTVLGSGSAAPTSQRGLTSQYIVCRGRHILIDCGEGTQMQIRKFGVKFQRIEHILISHLHGDHYFGLVGLLSSMHLMGRTKAIQIYGPEGLQEIIEIQLHHAGARLSFDVKFQIVNAKESGVLFEDDKFCIEYFPLVHRIPTTGFIIREKLKDRHILAERAEKDGVKLEYYHRLRKGEDVTDEDGNIWLSSTYTRPPDIPRAFAFCSDTRYDESIVPFVHGVNLLYHEATFIEQHADRAKATMHSTAKQAAQIAKLAEVDVLLMGHLSARYDREDLHLEEAKTIFDKCIVASDGETYTV